VRQQPALGDKQAVKGMSAGNSGPSSTGASSSSNPKPVTLQCTFGNGAVKA
jgi:hypothetical protein